MARFNTIVDIMKVLPKTNCRKCNAKTCLAFAAAVLKGDRLLWDCPFLDPEVAEQGAVSTRDTPDIMEDRRQRLEDIRQKMAAVDFPSSLDRLKARMSGDNLVIPCLGKDFSVSPEGVVTSGCHVNVWVAEPLLQYVLQCQGRDTVGEWIPLREMKGGLDWAPLFGQMCEKPLKKIIDEHTGLFEYMIEVFQAEPAPEAFESDIAVVLHPLPRLPILVCYWKPEDGLDSNLSLFFDRSAEDNLNIESVYTLATGLRNMFGKIAQTHDW